MSDSESSYAAAGVNIGAGQEAVRLMRPFAQSTYNNRVLGDIGGFGGLFKLDSYREPILVASADGVGTKINIAGQAGSFATIGADLVNHCINDIWVQGADPLFFLDYIAADSLNPQDAADIVRGMAEACSAAGIALIGGETAEMPGTYREGHYDVAGFIVGAVERWDLIDGTGIRAGDVLVGLPSTGLHTNGYSLARRVFDLDDHPENLDERPPELGGETVAEALLAVHRPYYRELKPMRRRVRGLAHITGGGYAENVPRVLPDNLRAVVDCGAWSVPPIFRLISSRGEIPMTEMYDVFNMGMGMIAVVRPQDAPMVMSAMEGSAQIGTIEERPPDGERIILNMERE